MSEPNSTNIGTGVECQQGQLGCINTYTVDSQVFFSIVSSGFLGLLCIVGFCLFQPFVSVYRGRLLSPQVAIKPPTWHSAGFMKFVYWVYPTITLREKELLATAGMDALMFERLIVFGLQFFGPVTVICCSVLLPLHATRHYLEDASSAAFSTLSDLTMSNMPPGSSLLWVHFVLVWLICLYAMWLLHMHYKWYVLLRQHYLTMGDSLTPWLNQQPPDAQQQAACTTSSGVVEVAIVSDQQQQQEKEQRQQETGGAGDSGSGVAVKARALVRRDTQKALMEVETLLLAPTPRRTFSTPQPPNSFFGSPSDSNTSSRTSSGRLLLPHGHSSSDGAAAAAAKASTAVAPAAAAAAAGGGAVAAGAAGAAQGSPVQRPKQMEMLRIEKRADSASISMGGLSSSGSGALGAAAGTPRRRTVGALSSAAQKALLRESAAVGAGQEWWEFATGDPLLDRHVVQVELPSRDVEADMDPTSDPTDPNHPSLLPLHGTSLYFDERSVLARKPSVRFRNTLSIPHPSGGGSVPLHVSNYAVLVTDVQQMLDVGREAGVAAVAAAAARASIGTGGGAGSAGGWSSGGDGRANADGFDHYGALDAGLADNRGGVVAALASCMQWVGMTLLFRWPCILNTHDLDALLREWGVHDARQLPLSSAASDVGTARLQLVEAVFRQLHPEEFHAVVPVHNFQAVDELLRKWNTDMQAYIHSKALLDLRNRRTQPGANHRTSTSNIPLSHGGSFSATSAAAAAAAATATAGSPFAASTQQQHRKQQQQQQAALPPAVDFEDDGETSCLSSWPCWRLKVPQEEVLEEQWKALQKLEACIAVAQQEALASTPVDAFIVLFKSPEAASLAARSAVFPQSINNASVFKVQPAPGPEDMLWQALWKPAHQRVRAFWGSIPWYIIIFIIPTGIFTAACNSAAYALCNADPSISQQAFGWFCGSRFAQFLLTVVTPFILLMVWQNAFIPAWLYKLELRKGSAISLSQMERNMLRIYFGWEVVNLFLGGVMASSLVSQVKTLLAEPENWSHILGAAFPNSANYFMNYVIARAFLMNQWRFLMPHGGMWRWLGQMLLTACTSTRHAATERYRAFIVYPASIRYGREPGLVLLIILIGTSYCVVAPLLTPFTLAYMCSAYVLWRYQMLYVCVRCYESGGRMWPLFFTCICWCLALFTLFTACIFLLKDANVQAVFVLVLLPLLYWFRSWCTSRYGSSVESLPMWLAHAAPRTHIDPAVYVPPALRPGAQGWFFESGKAWVRWGVPAYVDPVAAKQ